MKVWNKEEYVLANEWGLGLLSVRQDSRADLFAWWIIVVLLSQWQNAGMDRYERNAKNQK